MWIYLLLWAAISSYSIGIEETDIPMLESCVNTMLSAHNYRRRVEADPFALHYGDPAAEVFNIFSDYDIKYTEFLHHCLQTHHASLLSSSSLPQGLRPQQLAEPWQIYNNITDLSTILPLLSPILIGKIQNGMKIGLKEAGWRYDSRNIAFVSAMYVEAVTDNAKMTVKEMEDAFNERIEQDRRIALVVRPHDMQSKGDPDRSQSDNFLQQYLHTSDGNQLTVILMLSDRIKFSGGNILVRKNKDMIDADEEEFTDIDNDTALARRPHQNNKLPYDPQVYSPLTSKIARFVPELGGMVLIDRRTTYGIEPVSAGTMKALVLTFSVSSEASSDKTSVQNNVQDL
jgi:hypothetical protein